MDTPGVNVLGPMKVFGHDHAPHGHMHIKLDNVRVPKENILLGEGPRLRDLPAPAGSGPHPPLHAVGGPGPRRPST